MIGKVLDLRYKVTKALAKGGFGHTYLAQDLKRPGNPVCVVKQLKPENPRPDILEIAQKLFNREAKVLGKLGEHPQIPRLLAYFQEQEEFYLVQEYIEGQTLSDEFTQHRSLSKQQVIDLIIELLEILKFVHGNGVIHRDIKPQNIIRRERDNKLVLIDFGAVKEISNLGQGITKIGSPGYSPPEQNRGRPSYCSDLYAIGIIGIQALIGINPQQSEGGFDLDESGEEIIWEHRAQVKGHLADFLTKMVRYQEKDRYQSVDEALETLKRINSSSATTVPASSYPEAVNYQNPKQIDPTVSTTPRSKFWQKPPLLWSSALGIFTISVISFFLVKKLTFTDALQLPTNGKVVQGILDENNFCQDMMSGQDFACQEYTLPGKKGQKVTIEINSDDFDPFLILRKPDGNKLAVNGDISANNWNSEINNVDLPEDGNYIIVARTTFIGESGNYTIRTVVK